MLTKKCKVQISIGSYKREVYCNKVDRNVCHVLFGRPWLNDVNVICLEWDNSYKLRRDKVNYILTSLEKKKHQLKFLK